MRNKSRSLIGFGLGRTRHHMQDDKVLKARTPSKTSARRRFTIISPPLSVVLCPLSSIGQRLEYCLQIHLLWAKVAKQPRRHHPSPSINQQHNNHERMQTPWSSTSTGKNLGFGSSRPFGLPLPGRLRRNCRDGHGLHVHGHTASGTDLRDHRLRHPRDCVDIPLLATGGKLWWGHECPHQRHQTGRTRHHRDREVVPKPRTHQAR